MKEKAVVLLKFAVSAALVGFLLLTVDLDKVVNQIRQVSLPGLLTVSLLFFGSYLIGSRQWLVFLRAGGFHISFWRAAEYFYTGVFFNNFLFSSVGGDLVRLADVTHGEQERTSRVLATILVDRVFGLICLCLIGVAALFVVWLIHGIPSSLLLTVYAVLGSGLLVVSLFFLSNRIRFLFYLLAARLPLRKLRLGSFRFLNILSRFRKKRHVFLHALPWGLLNQAVKMVLGYAAARLVHGPEVPGLEWILLFFPVLGLVKVLPISFMGLGPHEVAGARLFATVSPLYGKAWSVPFLLLFQVVVMLANLFSGLVFLFRKEPRPAKSK